jgi:hypothetical protein
MSRKRVVLFLSFVILASVLITVGIFYLSAPKKPALYISNAEVLNIGRRYVEEKYGTDYSVNGDVSEVTFSNGTGTWTYPAASFRVPANWQQPGTLVNVMVNPETGEIFTVLTSFSKNMPP